MAKAVLFSLLGASAVSWAGYDEVCRDHVGVLSEQNCVALVGSQIERLNASERDLLRESLPVICRTKTSRYAAYCALYNIELVQLILNPGDYTNCERARSSLGKTVVAKCIKDQSSFRFAVVPFTQVDYLTAKRLLPLMPGPARDGLLTGGGTGGGTGGVR